METNICNWNQNQIAIRALQEGQVIAFPTETVYGLGVISSDKDAFDRLCRVKGRPENKPFTLMVGNYGDIARFAHVDSRIIALIHEYMPGQVTFLLKARAGIPYHLDLGTGVIGVRFPGLPSLCDLIEAVGEPLLVPSANKSGLAPCTSKEEILQVFGGEIACLIGDDAPQGEPSTIVDLSHEGEIKLVRQGVIPFEKLQKSFENAEKHTISLGSDHGGYQLKEAAKAHLQAIGYVVIDEGCDSTASCDYPIYAKAAAKDIVEGKASLGFLFCTTGEGVAIAANKTDGVRCGIGYNDIVTAKNREHNHANMIAFGQKHMNQEDVLRRIDIFLTQMPSDLAKHVRRVDQLEK